jgi:hypothetical protein
MKTVSSDDHRPAPDSGRGQSPPADNGAPLYRRVLGEAWHSLPQPLQAMHDLRGERAAAGAATVERGACPQFLARAQHGSVHARWRALSG